MTKEYIRIGEKVSHVQLDNGLHIYVNHKPEYHKSFAFFATKYGGMDLKFQLNGQWQDTPAGIAHFLEHKMFDTEGGNALQDLSENGANPNAFTSSAITGYYFESTEKFEENLKVLLSFVSVPYFTKESVDKEQGIIGQEIRMIEDSAENQVFYGMLESLYENNPIRTSIAGTVDSIAKITAETLYDCHKAFYHPSNMVLCVAGNVDVDTVVSIAKEITTEESAPEIPRDYGVEEKVTVYKHEHVEKMAVSAPIFQMGWKTEALQKDVLRGQLLGDLVAECLFGTSTPLYAKLYSEGLVNKNFAYGYESYPGCAFLTLGGESKDPWAVSDAIQSEAQRIAKVGVDSALWERLKKAVYGSQVRRLNSFQHICIGMAQGHFEHFNLYEFPQVFESISKQDVETCISEWIRENRTSLSVVEPKEA